MSETSIESEQAAIVREIADDASLEQQRALLEWGKELLVIRDSNDSARAKARAAVAATASRKVVWPIVRVMLQRLKRLGWDERSWSARLGIGVVGATIAVFGGQGAGIAALGTAVGVPLWVVFGAGGAFAGMLIDELEAAVRGRAQGTRSPGTASRETGPGHPEESTRDDRD